MDRQKPPQGVQDLLSGRGFSLAAAEKAAGLARGSLSRRLRGRRGYGLQLDVALRLSQATGIPLQTLADGFVVSLAAAEERCQAIRAVERARLEAELRP